jgi:hypothetical protein
MDARVIGPEARGADCYCRPDNSPSSRTANCVTQLDSSPRLGA